LWLIKINQGILATHRGLTIEKIVHDTERDNFMSPEEAKAYGIIDDVYSVPDQSLISEAKHKGLLGGEGSAVAAEDDSEGPTPAKG
jgi:hypothetical protein